MTDPFSNPASASGSKITDYSGRLLLVTPIEYVNEVETVHGTKDAVRASVVVIDEAAPGSSIVEPDILLFQGRLIGQTKSMIGKLVLGRLGQGEAKPGKNAPWQIADPTEDDKTKARAYLASVAPSL